MCRAVCEGDENTGFFHASASQRHRSNTTRMLDVGGAVVIDHPGKAAALLDYYSSLLGRARLSVWRFDLAALYHDAARVNAEALIAPFTALEIKEAAGLLDRTSARGLTALALPFTSRLGRWSPATCSASLMLSMLGRGTSTQSTGRTSPSCLKVWACRRQVPSVRSRSRTETSRSCAAASPRGSRSRWGTSSTSTSQASLRGGASRRTLCMPSR